MVNAFGRTIIVLNSIDAAEELLNDRSEDYSERPRQVMVGELYVSQTDYPYAC